MYQYTEYEYIRNPRSEYPELIGLENIVLSENLVRVTRRGEVHRVRVKGCGAVLEQRFNQAPSVRSYKEIERNWFTPYPKSEADLSPVPLRKNRRGDWVPTKKVETIEIRAADGGLNECWGVGATEKGKAVAFVCDGHSDFYHCVTGTGRYIYNGHFIDATGSCIKIKQGKVVQCDYKGNHRRGDTVQLPTRGFVVHFVREDKD